MESHLEIPILIYLKNIASYLVDGILFPAGMRRYSKSF